MSSITNKQRFVCYSKSMFTEQQQATLDAWESYNESATQPLSYPVTIGMIASKRNISQVQALTDMQSLYRDGWVDFADRYGQWTASERLLHSAQHAVS